MTTITSLRLEIEVPCRVDRTMWLGVDRTLGLEKSIKGTTVSGDLQCTKGPATPRCMCKQALGS